MGQRPRPAARRRRRRDRSVERRRARAGVDARVRPERVRDADRREEVRAGCSATSSTRSTTARSAPRRRPDRRSRWSPARARSPAARSNRTKCCTTRAPGTATASRFVDIAAGGLGSVGFVRALAASSDGYFYQLGYRLGHERLRYYAPAIRFGLALGDRLARRVSRQLADRRVDAKDVRPRLPSRAERRLPARDRPRRDASDTAADGQHHRDGRQRRHRSIARTSSPRSARRAAASSNGSTIK